MARAGSAGGRILRELRQTGPLALATAGVCALAALLALFVAGGHFEARSTLRLDHREPFQVSTLLDLAQTDDFAAGLASRSDVTRFGADGPSLTERVVAILEGTSLESGRRGLARPVLERVYVGPGGKSDEIDIVALSDTAEAARGLATAAAAELESRIATERQEGPIPSPADQALADARILVARLERDLAGRAVVDTREVERKLAAAEASAQAAKVTLDRTQERVEGLVALERGDLSSLPAVGLRDRGLAVRLGEVAAFEGEVSGLVEALPADNPRRRIAERRLDQLKSEARDEVALERVKAERERDELRRSHGAIAAEATSLRAELAEHREEQTVSIRLTQELRNARNGLAAQEEAVVASPPERSAVLSPVEAREVPPPYGLAAGIAALAGLVLASAAGLVRSLVTPREADPTTGSVSIATATCPDPDHALDEVLTTAEAMSALLASPVSRVLCAAVREEAGSAISLDIARGLAEEAQLVLLIDLSRTQAAACQGGIGANVAGFREVAARAVKFSAAIVVDERSTVDLLPAGRRPESLPTGLAVAEALRFARRAYDHVLVDCGSKTPSEIVELADENCAVLLAAGSSTDAAVADRLLELRAAGLETAILRG